ncbi:TPA: hypothetical protein NIA45_004705 [Pseudomonas aeruginosa]|nr:hypothetical protein [Pseudomonas aeruginosa]
MHPVDNPSPTLTLLSQEQRIPLDQATAEHGFSLWGPESISAHAIVTGAADQKKGVIAANIAEMVGQVRPQVVWITDDGSFEDVATKASAAYHRLGFTTGRSTPGNPDNSGQGLLPPQDEPAYCINPFWRPLDNEGQAYPLNLDEQMDIARLLAVMLESVNAELSEPFYRRDLMPLLYSVIGVCFRIEREKSPSKEIVFTDFIRYLKLNNAGVLRGEYVADLLAPFHGEGKFASLFDGACRLPQAEGLAIFGMQELEHTPALAPAAVALHQHLGVRIRFDMARATKKAILFNHTWGRHLTRNYVEALSGLLRDFRRYGGSCIFITGEEHALERIQQACPGDDDDGVYGNLSHHLHVQQGSNGLSLQYTLLQGTGCPAASASKPGKPTATDMFEFDHKVKPLLSWASRFSDNPLAYLVETLNAKLPSSTSPAK